MRTTRRSHRRIARLLLEYLSGRRDHGPGATVAPLLAARAEAVTRGPAVWFNREFLTDATDEEFIARVEHFYSRVVALPLFRSSLRRHAARVRAGTVHVLTSQDGVAVRLHRCLTNRGAFTVPGLGPAFWSAVVQAIDPLRHPAWTPATVAGARRLGLIQRQRIWYGDLLSACDDLRRREPRLTALHVDELLTTVGLSSGEYSEDRGWIDPLARLAAQGRIEQTLASRLAAHARRLAPAREILLASLAADDGPGAIAAFDCLDPRLGCKARAWDSAALLPWIAWLWNDDEPLAEVAACERESAGISRCLAAAVLHLRAPERFPLWSSRAANGLARIADAPVDSYPLYVEAVQAIADQYDLHPFETVNVLAALSSEGAKPRTCG